MAFPQMPVEERMLAGLFLCSVSGNPVLEQLNRGWNEQAHLTFEEKCSILSNHYSVDVRLLLHMNLFPFRSELTEGMEQDKFALSHLRQPYLFIRLRPGHEIMVKEKLKNEAIEYSQVSETCLALANSSKIDKTIELNKEAVVQDYSSQRTAELLFNLKSKIQNPKYSVWDCCAASGGKSIMIHDLYPGIDLTVAVNGYDDGASTGEVRRFLGDSLGPSDFRKNAVRLSRLLQSSPAPLSDLLELRLDGVHGRDAPDRLVRAASGRTGSDRI